MLHRKRVAAAAALAWDMHTLHFCTEAFQRQKKFSILIICPLQGVFAIPWQKYVCFATTYK